MGRSLNVAIDYFKEVPCTPRRKIVDISGDGTDDAGLPSIKAAILNAVENDVTVNGLAVQGADQGIFQYYRKEVITPDGFAILAETPEEFPRVMRKKLIMEIGNAGWDMKEWKL